MKITSTKVKTSSLRAGDLFSAYDQAMWDSFMGNEAIGLRVYVRTDTPCPENQANEDIYLIKVAKK
jgi:hypothetical protein